jgi:protease-4
LALSGPVDAQLVANTMLLEFARERRSDRRWTQFKRALFAFVLLGGFGLSLYSVLKSTGSILPAYDSGYKVGLVSIKGVIGQGQGSADSVIPALKKVFEDARTEVVVLRIDSPGGSPSEAERIYSELERLKVKHNKPVEAVIDNVGASAAYLIAIHTDRITAGQYSLVGSVGAIMQYWNAADLAGKVGITQQTFASGSLKDMGNLVRKPTEVELAKGNELVTGIASVFASEVRARRGDRLKFDGAHLTTGEAWSGVDAKSGGLVDDLGTLESVLARFDSKGRSFGPFPNNGLGGMFSRWAGAVGSEIANGMLERLQATMQGAQWRTE